MGSHQESHAPGDISHQLGHIQPMKVYNMVFGALIVLTVVTVLVAKYCDFGNLNLVIAMLIASVKAGMVALFFMHLKYENPLTWVYVVFPVFLLGLLLGGVFMDNPVRPEFQRAGPIKEAMAGAHHDKGHGKEGHGESHKDGEAHH